MSLSLPDVVLTYNEPVGTIKEPVRENFKIRSDGNILRIDEKISPPFLLVDGATVTIPLATTITSSGCRRQQTR